MKDIKEKPTAHMPRSNATGEIPKAALKKAWAEAKEKSRTMLRESTSTQGDGDYTKPQTFEIDKMRRFHTECATMHTGTGQEIPAFSGSRRPVFSSLRKQVM